MVVWQWEAVWPMPARSHGCSQQLWGRTFFLDCPTVLLGTILWWRPVLWKGLMSNNVLLLYSHVCFCRPWHVYNYIIGHRAATQWWPDPGGGERGYSQWGAESKSQLGKVTLADSPQHQIVHCHYRAVYRNADIYLLDDPLSAVDAAVSRHIFDQWG